MGNFIYYPMTQYHIILSFILREKNKAHSNSIILDENCFSKSFINRVIRSNGWEHVYVLKKYPRLQNFTNRNLLYKVKYDEIFNIKHANFVFFTFGGNFSNLLANSVYKNNNILMGEDGVFPYYGLDIVKEYYNNLKNEPNINKLKRFVKRKINAKIEFNIQRIDKLLLLKPEWLPQEVISQYEIVQISVEQKAIQKVFNELTCLFEYKKEHIFNGIDIVYFDSDLSLIGNITGREEYLKLFKIFTQLHDAKIFIKLKPTNNYAIIGQRQSIFDALQKDTKCNFVISNPQTNYPWEIVYFNNATDLREVTFMSPNFSTALISQKIFFGLENNVICLRNIFVNEFKNSIAYESVTKLMERIRGSCLLKNIYTPESYEEINKMSGSGKTGQCHKWEKLLYNASKKRNEEALYEQKTEKESCPGIQGESSPGSIEREPTGGLGS